VLHRLYDVKFRLIKSRTDVGSDISFVYSVAKAIKSAPVGMKFNEPMQFNFETVVSYNHNGSEYYLTLGSIGEQRVDFFIWNSTFEVVETVHFRWNKWFKVGDFVFQLKSSTDNTAELIVSKQTT